MPTHIPDFDPPVPAVKLGRCLDSDAALSSHYWGVIAIFTWWIPILGQVAAVAGLVRGYQGWFSKCRQNARIGMVLSINALGLMFWVLGWFVSLMDLAAQSPSARY